MVVMTRRDKVGQAISGAISTLSGKWFSDGQEAPIGRDKIPELVRAAYGLLARYQREAVQMDALCARYKGKLLHKRTKMKPFQVRELAKELNFDLEGLA